MWCPAGLRRPLLFWLLLTSSLAFASGAATAAPILEVKARPWVDRLSVQARGRRVEISGTLRDNLNQPIPGVRLSVSASGVEARPFPEVTTGPDGRFTARTQARQDGRIQVQVRFAGSALLGTATAGAEATVGRTSVKLTADLPPRIAQGQARDLRVRARSKAGLPLSGLILTTVHDGVELIPVRTDRRGEALFRLPIAVRGRHTVDVHLDGDEDHEAAHWSGQYHGAAPLSLALRRASEAPLLPGAPVALEGRIEGGAGGSVDIVLVANGAPIDRISTSGEGDFAFAADPDDTGSGSIRLRAVSDAGDPTLIDGASAPITVDVPPPPPPSPLWAWAPAGLACLSIIGAFWRRWPGRRRRKPARARPTGATELPPAFALKPATRGAGLEVTVHDAVTRAALNAHVVLLDADTEPPDDWDATRSPPGAQPTSDGALSLPAAGAGQRLWVGAPGYVPLVQPLEAPSGRAEIHLKPMRAWAQHRFMTTLARGGRPKLRFGRETPREAAEALIRRGAAMGPVDALIEAVEAACFGAALPGPAEVARVDQLCAAVERSLPEAQS